MTRRSAALCVDPKQKSGIVQVSRCPDVTSVEAAWCESESDGDVLDVPVSRMKNFQHSRHPWKEIPTYLVFKKTYF